MGGSSTGLASPPMGEAVARSIRDGLQDRANALINSGTSVGVAFVRTCGAALDRAVLREAWAAFALVGLAVLAWNAVVMPREAVAEQVEDENVGPSADGAEAGNGSGRTRVSSSSFT